MESRETHETSKPGNFRNRYGLLLPPPRAKLSLVYGIAVSGSRRISRRRGAVTRPRSEINNTDNSDNDRLEITIICKSSKNC